MATAELNADGSSKLTASEYQQLVGRIQDWVEYAVPAAETAVVVSRGDEDLVQLGARPAWHFPRLPDGRWAGYHPADSADAIAQLEDLRVEGAAYFVLPNTAFWWLDFYEDFNRHLDKRYEAVVSNEDCRIYRLLEEGSWAADRALSGTVRIPGITRADGRILSQYLDKVLPSEARAAVLSAATAPLPSGTEPWQPPQRAISDSEASNRELAALKTRGLDFLVIPSAVFDWLDDHPALGEALSREHRLVIRQQYICEIHELSAAQAQPAPTVPAPQATTPDPRQRPSLLERLGLRSAHRNGQ